MFLKSMINRDLVMKNCYFLQMTCHNLVTQSPAGVTAGGCQNARLVATWLRPTQHWMSYSCIDGAKQRLFSLWCIKQRKIKSPIDYGVSSLRIPDDCDEQYLWMVEWVP